MEAKTKNSKKMDVWDEIEEHMKNPNFVKAVKEFIKLTT